jgi:hypothetical protein
MRQNLTLVLADEQIMSNVNLLVWKGRAEIVIEEYVIQVRSKHSYRYRFRSALRDCVTGHGLAAIDDWWVNDSNNEDHAKQNQDTRWIQVLKPKAGRDVWKDDKESRNLRNQEDQTARIMEAVNEIKQHVCELDKDLKKHLMKDVARTIVRNSRGKQADKESKDPPGLQPRESKARDGWDGA